MNIRNDSNGIADNVIFHQIYKQIYNKKGTLQKLIGKYYIQEEKAESLEVIKIENVKIDDFSFLKFFPNITEVIFEKCDFSNLISQQEIFNNVESIEIDGKDTDMLENINFLSAFPNMIDISIGKYTEVVDISELKYHKNLTEINLDNVLKIDTSILKECKNLDMICFDNYRDKPISKVDYTNKGSIDLSFLSSLPKLDTLTLGGQNLSDVTFISKLEKLDYLELMQCSGLTGIESLQSLRKLTFLEIEDEKMTDEQVEKYEKMFSYVEKVCIDNSAL